jgi:hypothetical protein
MHRFPSSFFQGGRGKRLEEKLMDQADRTIETMAFYHLAFNGVTGVFFLTEKRGIFDEAETYRLMQNLIPVTVWGWSFVATALLFLMVIIIDQKAKYLCAIVGGLVSALLMLFYAMASFDTSDSALPWRYLALGSFALALSVMGVLAWIRTKKPKT